MIDNFDTIKKGTKLLVNNGLGECTAYSMESIKQGRGFKSTLLVDLKAMRFKPLEYLCEDLDADDLEEIKENEND